MKTKTKTKTKQKILKIFAMCILFLVSSPLLLAQNSLTNNANTQSVCVGVHPYEINPNPNSTYTWTIIDQGTGAPPLNGEADFTLSAVPPAQSPGSYIEVDFTISGTYVLSVLELDANSCQGATVDLVITVNPLDDPTFTFADYCEDSPGTPVLDPLATTGGTFTFTPPSAGVSIDPTTGVITGGVGGDIFDVTYTTPGLLGCPEFLTVSVTVESPPLPNAGPDDVICEGLNYDLINAINPGAVGTITWITPTGTAANFSDATILNPVYTPTAADILAGFVILELQISGIAPCTTVSDFITITINATPTPGPIWHN